MTPPRATVEARNSRRVVGTRVSALFDEHASMVFGLCRLLLRDHHEAEDASQQTFVSAYRALLRGTEPREPGPWLAAIARNECRARLRKRVRAPIPLEDEIEVADGADLAEVADLRAEFDLLTDEIAKLPSRQREAIALRDFLGLSYEEVASALSVSVPVVESLLFRARRRLRDTVRTIPRYAAGVVMVPVALRAAVAREIPELDAAAAGGGAAVGFGAAGLAKLLSMPFTVKAVATTAALVAAGSVMAPQLVHPPGSGQLAEPGMAALGQVEGAGIEPRTAVSTAAGATLGEAVAGEPATTSAAPASESPTADPPAVEAEPADTEPALDPDRTSASTEVPVTDPPELPPAAPPGEPSACAEDPDGAAATDGACETPAEEPEPAGAEPDPGATQSDGKSIREQFLEHLHGGDDSTDERGSSPESAVPER